jgi:hypothetical protein
MFAATVDTVPSEWRRDALPILVPFELHEKSVPYSTDIILILVLEFVAPRCHALMNDLLTGIWCSYNINEFKYNQQDTTLRNGIYCYKCSTCFRRVLRPPSGAQNCYTQHRVFVELFLLLTAIVGELFHLTRDSGKKQKKLDKYPMLCITVLSS